VSSAKEKARSPVEPGELVVGKYRVERVIGAGGMGVVVAATHVELDQKVALKFLHAHVLDGAGAIDRFSREAKAAVRLKSEHVARVYDVGVLPDGAPFSVMELLDGVDVANYAAQKKPLTVSEAVEIVLQACDAIVEAHAAGIVHRDLKPQNLFVTRKANGAPLIKVLDFGVSKWTGQDFSLTDSSVVVGSPLYMAPEQMRAARNAEPRSDIWALGVILYELLAGKVPFDGATVTELCLKVVTDPPAPLRDVRTDIPEPLASIVARCLEKDPTKRFENVAMLAQALEPFALNVTTSRPWRSMVETGDSLDIGELPTMPEGVDVTTDRRRANLVETDEGIITDRERQILDRPPPSSHGPRRLAFTRGVAAGALLTAIGAVAGVIIWASAAHPTNAAASGAPSSSNAVASASAMIDPPPTSATTTASAAPQPSAPPSATPRSAASTGHVHLTARPLNSGKTAPIAGAAASSYSSPNGAPILH
jgi:serine/threonine-protein kinase